MLVIFFLALSLILFYIIYFQRHLLHPTNTRAQISALYSTDRSSPPFRCLLLITRQKVLEKFLENIDNGFSLFKRLM